MLKRNIIANYLGQGWTALMGIIFVPLYIKYLGMEVTVVGYSGALEFDSTKPDGTMRKLMDVSFMQSLGWQAATSLGHGLVLAYKDYVNR